MNFERARTDEQVQERIREILSCSIKIYEQQGIEKLNFLEISKITEFTRPTIYKYFKTKEEIMLSLILLYMEKLVTFITSRVDEKSTKEEIARALTNGFKSSPEFMDLFGILYTVIEKNSSVDALANFKREILALKVPLAKCIGTATKCDDASKIYNFLMIAMSLAMGTYPMCNLSTIQKNAIEKSKTGYEAPVFDELYYDAILVHLDKLYL